MLSTRRAALAAALALATVIVPALPVAAGGSDYRSFSDGVSGADYGRGFAVDRKSTRLNSSHT